MATYISTGYYSISTTYDTIAGLSWNRLLASSLANRVDIKTLYSGSYATIDLGTQAAGSRDWLNLMVNGNWNLYLYNTEYVTAGAGYNSVSLQVMNGANIAFTTDGSLANLRTGVGADGITYNGVDGSRTIANNMVSVSLGSGNDRLALQNIAAKGKFDGGAGRDKLVLNSNSDISNVDSIVYFEDLEINGNSTMTVRMNNQFFTNHSVVNKNDAAILKLVSYAKSNPTLADQSAYGLLDVKQYVFQEKAAGAFGSGVTFHVNAATPGVSVTANGSFGMTVDVHGVSASGTYQLGAGTGQVRLSDGGSLQSATVKTTGNWTLAVDKGALGASVTVASKHLMGDADNQAAHDIITSDAGGLATVKVATPGGLGLGTSGHSYVLDSDIGAWEIGVASAVTNYVSMIDCQSVKLGSGQDTLTYALGGSAGRSLTYIDLGSDTARDVIKIAPTINDASAPLALRAVGAVGEVRNFVTSDAGVGHDVLDLNGLSTGLTYKDANFIGLFFNLAFDNASGGWNSASTVINASNLSALNKVFLPDKTMVAFNLYDSTLYIDTNQSGFFNSTDFSLKISGVGNAALTEFLNQNLTGYSTALPDRVVEFDRDTYGAAFQVDMQTGNYSPVNPYATATDAADANIVRLYLSGGLEVTTALTSRAGAGASYTDYDTVDASSVGIGATTRFDFATGEVSVSAGTIGAFVTDIQYIGVERYIGGAGTDIAVLDDQASAPNANDARSQWDGLSIELGSGVDEIYVDNVTLGVQVFLNSATNGAVVISDDFLHLGGNADIRLASVIGFQRLWLDANASVTMRNVGQYDQLAKDSKGYHVIGDGSGIETITLSEAGVFSAISGVDHYKLSSTGTNQLTISALADNSTEAVSVTGGSQADTVIITGSLSGTSTFTGAYALGTGANLVTFTSSGAGANIAGVEVTSVGGTWTLTLEGASGGAVVAARHLYGANAASSVVATGGSNLLTVKVVDGALGASNDYYTLASAVETWSIGSDVPTSNYVTLQNNGKNVANQQVTGYGADDFFKASSLSFTSLVGGSGTDQLGLTTAGAIGLANVTGVEKLVTAGGSANTLSNVGNDFTHFTLGGAGNTLTSGAAGVTVVGGDGSDSVTLSAASPGKLNVSLGEGNDQLEFSAATSPVIDGSSTLTGGNGTDTLYLNNSDSKVSATIDLVSGVTLIGFEALAGGANNQVFVLGNTSTGVLKNITSIALDGGTGDTLDLRGGGTFDFSTLGTFSGVDIITAANESLATTVKLNTTQLSGLTGITGATGGSDVLHFTDDVAATLPSGISAYETVHFGNAKLTVSALAGISTLESSNSANSEVAWGDSKAAANFSAVTFSGVKKLDVSVTTSDATITASKMSGVESIKGSATQNLVVQYSGDDSTIASSLAVQGASQFDTLQIASTGPAGTLTVSSQLFNASMINLLGTSTVPDFAETLKFKLASAAPRLDLTAVTTTTNLAAVAVDGSSANDVIKSSSTDAVRGKTTIDLLAGGGSDKVVMNNGAFNAGATSPVTSAVTVSHFEAANDQVFVSSINLGDAFFEGFGANTTISTNGNGDYYEVTAATAADLKDLLTVAGTSVKGVLGAAIGTMAKNQTGIAIVYSSTDVSTADAGFYHFTLGTAADATAGTIGVELIGIISGVGYNNLSSTNAVFNANVIAAPV